ncbi:MAG: hypothetical protein JWO62_3401 [Acidimicrobiaceae bacterium]|nr:hypothetical protein [Acidimicrobiaceae bacterium]
MPDVRTVATWELRAEFARRLSSLYGHEVPAYNLLVEVCHEVNAEVLAREGAAAERLGSIGRVTAERHGAIRVGSAVELRQVARIFGALGMFPTGFYDLRDAYPNPIPVVSTAFRPTESAELARNPFRVFTSLLVVDDRRFFDASLEKRLTSFIGHRELFPPELLALADRARDGGLAGEQAERFLDLATGAFALSSSPVERAWYAELEAISAVAADIGGITTTHVNHLTPRVLDIDALYARMGARGIAMIDEIQGPPAWAGPSVLLRQTSFKALAEQRMFREPDGNVSPGELRVRFGEVEARGVALTAAGRERYDALTAETDRLFAAGTGASRQEIGAEVWARGFPSDEVSLARQDLAYFAFRVDPDRRRDGSAPPIDLAGLLDGEWVFAEPIVYEDFLPRSAAGIFSSNLTGPSSLSSTEQGQERDVTWLAEMLETDISAPEELYGAERARSLALVADRLGISAPVG